MPSDEFETECFLISPIGGEGSFDRDRANEIRDFIVEPVAEELGLKVIRADDIASPGDITKQVVEHCVKARAAVADLSGANANVFYELGVRHVAGRFAVMISEDSDLPFDVAAMRAVLFNRSSLASVESCKDQIRRQLSAALEADDSPYPELSDWLATQRGSVASNSMADPDRYQRILDRQVEGLEGLLGELSHHAGQVPGASAELPFRWFSWVRTTTDSLGPELRELLRLRLGFDADGPLSMRQASERLGVPERAVLTMEAELARFFSTDTVQEWLQYAEPWWPGAD